MAKKEDKLVKTTTTGGDIKNKVSNIKLGGSKQTENLNKVIETIKKVFNQKTNKQTRKNQVT